MTDFQNWKFPFKTNPEFKTKTAYFCMEYGIDQSFKIYSGGLGFLAGSHMRSAYDLKQPLIGIGMLWKYGYYDQTRHEDQSLRADFVEKSYAFLQDTGIIVKVEINGNPNVHVKAFYLAPEVFGTAPMFFLSTDVPENDHLARTICHRLYDNNPSTRVAQSIVLGQGGGKVIDAIGGVEVYHLNEGHGLPLAFHLQEKYPKLSELKKHLVFTTHTPELAGNEEHDAQFLNKMGFFKRTLSTDELAAITHQSPILNYTLTALRYSKIANGVSQLHGAVSRKMWEGNPGICKIIAITNAQNTKYWADDEMYKALEKGKDKVISKKKQDLKEILFREVANQTGKIFDEKALTIVWARRFAAYKRADIFLDDMARLERLLSSTKYPIQIIWAGKPYPLDEYAVSVFNRLVAFTKERHNVAVLTGYELELSRLLKNGADVWLNTPRRPREASGTSGMTASMNGAINFSIFDGWVCEFAKHGKNAFITPVVDSNLPIEEQDRQDKENLFKVLEQEILPLYYDKPDAWLEIVKNSLKDVVPFFNSDRMAREYYERMYSI
jgi:starch phosphorylase